MRSRALCLIIALLFLYPDKWDLLKILGRVKSNGHGDQSNLAPHHWWLSAQAMLLTLCSAEHLQWHRTAHNSAREERFWLLVLYSSSTLFEFLIWTPPPLHYCSQSKCSMIYLTLCLQYPKTDFILFSSAKLSEHALSFHAELGFLHP